MNKKERNFLITFWKIGRKNFINLPTKKENPLEGINILKEYELIKSKKSKLSRKLRDLIIYEVESAPVKRPE